MLHYLHSVTAFRFKPVSIFGTRPKPDDDDDDDDEDDGDDNDDYLT